MTIGQRMKERRKSLGLSAENIADKLNVSPATIYRYERGDIEKLPGHILEPLSSILQTTPAYLMGWENESGESDLVLGQKYFEQLGYPPAQAEVMAEQAAQAGQRIDNEFDGLNLAETLEALASRPECRMLFSITKDATKEEVLQAVKIIEVLRNNK